MVNNMNNLIIANKEQLINGLVENHELGMVTTSLKVAESFGKQHKNVIQTIEMSMAENSAVGNLYHEGEYESNGRKFKMYYMGRDGFSILAMGFTGAKATEFKLAFLSQFNEMEQYIKNQQFSISTELLEKMSIEHSETKEVVVALVEQVKNIEETQRITTTQELELTELVNLVVTYELGGKDSIDYISNAKKTFPKVWKSVKRMAGVARKGDIPKNKYDEIIDFVNNWSLSSVPKNQMKLDI